MKVRSFKSLWGMEGPLERQFERIAEAGYDGIESPLPSVMEQFFGFPADDQQFRSLLERYGLRYIAMLFTGGDNHQESFRRQAEQAADYNPILINAHSAKDGMAWNEQLKFFEEALAVERRLGIPIGHETHRGRAMFTPWTTAALLREFPELKLTADFSHWVCVCESLLEDRQEELSLAIQRTVHIHARVGYAQGPQVPHPGAPEYAIETAAHEEWWRRIVQSRSQYGSGLTFTPEFGPPPYMPRLPFTSQPVTDVWQVCLWMKERFEDKVLSH